MSEFMIALIKILRTLFISLLEEVNSFLKEILKH